MGTEEAEREEDTGQGIVGMALEDYTDMRVVNCIITMLTLQSGWLERRVRCQRGFIHLYQADMLTCILQVPGHVSRALQLDDRGVEANTCGLACGKAGSVDIP